MIDKDGLLKSWTELSAENREKDRFGEDPLSEDKLKIRGIHLNKNGKYYQQIGDEFFECEELNNKEKK